MNRKYKGLASIFMAFVIVAASVLPVVAFTDSFSEHEDFDHKHYIKMYVEINDYDELEPYWLDGCSNILGHNWGNWIEFNRTVHHVGNCLLGPLSRCFIRIHQIRHCQRTHCDHAQMQHTDIRAH